MAVGRLADEQAVALVDGLDDALLGDGAANGLAEEVANALDVGFSTDGTGDHLHGAGLELHVIDGEVADKLSATDVHLGGEVGRLGGHEVD